MPVTAEGLVAQNRSDSSGIRKFGSVETLIEGVLSVERISCGHVIALCAEPDMGKTTILSHICQIVDPSFGMAKYVDLSLCEPGNAGTHVVRSCRQMSHYASPDNVTLLAIDNVPAMDEGSIARAARAIRKFVLLNGDVLIALTPEGEGLVEALPEATCYRSSDLLVGTHEHTRGDSSASNGAIGAYTHGIPSLVKSALLLPRDLGVHPERDLGYVTVLSEVVEHSLRPSLIREERELRLAMVELGSGNISDLATVTRGVDPSTVESLDRNAPFFSLDAVTGNFACAGVVSTDCLLGVMRRIRGSFAGMSRVSSAVANMLAERGDFSRAGVVIIACTPRDRADLILRYPAQFVDAGCVSMVEDAISFAAKVGEMEGVPEARLALSCVLNPTREYESLSAGLGDCGATPSLGALVALRDALAGRGARHASHEGGKVCGNAEGVCASVQVALRMLSLMEDFRFGDAYAYLLGCAQRLSRNSFAAGVLWGEYMLSMGLSGNTPTREDLMGFDDLVRFAEESGFSFLSQVLSAVSPLVSVLAGREESASAIESCAQRAAIMGMTRIQALCLVALAISDQRVGSGARSFVRLGQAAELAAKSRDAHLLATCRMLQLATKRALGERVTADEVLAIRTPARLSVVGRMLAAVIERSDAARFDVIGKLRTSHCPKGASWVVHLLASDYGDLSARFCDIAPNPWISEARRCAIVACEFGDRPMAEMVGEEAADPSDGAYRLDVSLLGGLRISVNGAPIEVSAIERRRAKSLLVLLAAAAGHQLRRFEAMESVWPEYDFHDARQRVYEATSVLRTELVTKLGLKGADPLVSNRGAGTIGLNTACVHCDVDDFEELAKTVLANSRLRPSDVLSQCATLERMYRGDVFVPQTDGAGIIEARRDEMRRLYADVMVFASTQALSLGKVQTAVHCAKNACQLDEFREDAELGLVRALAASGRRLEAEKSFGEFADRLVREKKRPPSRELREAYHQVIAGSEELVLHVGNGGADDEQRRAASA